MEFRDVQHKNNEMPIHFELIIEIDYSIITLDCFIINADKNKLLG